MNSNTALSSAQELTNTLAAVYATEHDAREAIGELHKAGFKKTWLGMTKPADSSGETLVENTDGLSRFFSMDRMPLHKALLAHGVSESQAKQIEGDIAPGCAVLTVYGEDNPARARELMSEHKGQVVGGDSAAPSAVTAASADPRTGVKKDDRDDHDDRDDMARAGAATGAATRDVTNRGVAPVTGASGNIGEYGYEEDLFTEDRGVTAR